jgi:hypothetical protein
MKKSKKLIISASIVVCMLAFSAVVVANTTDSIPSWMHKADEFVAKMDKEKKDKSGVELQPTNNESVYDSYLEKAKTQEQKDALLALKKDTSIGIGEWKRDALKIIGELPHDVKRIKIEDAERVIKENKDQDAIIKAFNEIAGAPDWEGGSGIHRIIYFIDNNHKEGIFIINNNIMHVVTDEKGEQVRKPLRGDVTLSEPKPTSLPTK